ncbi:hypothetical protein MTQ00_10495 [Chryseobacterium sp. B21-037]|uniref:hypothetical protein n=1 Tax=Chryseobacterium sp. B21-037 TaxID=2926038 RepID=UPI00235963C1|nr:hypothetical protein [Chryseobacterium sp. B21-037]MDC8104969.1 hypothetical protein [Chryseobacterium sp. B21-037]
MYLFNRNHLQQFDIILVRFPEVEESNRIRENCGSQYSHAIIYLGNGSFVEGNDPTVCLFSYHRYYFQDLENVKVLRLSEELATGFDSELAEKVLRGLSNCNYSRRLLLYTRNRNIDQSIIDNFHENFKWNGGIVCTSLIGLPLYAGGIDLSNTNEPYYIDFSNIESFQSFEDVTKLVLEETDSVTADTYDYISMCPTNTNLEKQGEAIYELNRFVESTFRNLNKNYELLQNTQLKVEDLQFSTWEDIVPVLMKIYLTDEGQTIDIEMSELLLSTKYNLLWFEEVHSKKEQFFPYYYFPFNRFLREDLEFMKETLSVTLDRNSANEDVYFQNFTNCPCRTLHILLDMYRSFSDLIRSTLTQYEQLIINYEQLPKNHIDNQL